MAFFGFRASEQSQRSLAQEWLRGTPLVCGLQPAVLICGLRVARVFSVRHGAALDAARGAACDSPEHGLAGLWQGSPGDLNVRECLSFL